MDYNALVQFVQEHFTDGLALVIGSGLSAAAAWGCAHAFGCVLALQQNAVQQMRGQGGSGGGNQHLGEFLVRGHLRLLGLALFFRRWWRRAGVCVALETLRYVPCVP